LGIVVAELLQAGCHFHHPTNSIKALKDDSVHPASKSSASVIPKTTYRD